MIQEDSLNLQAVRPVSKDSLNSSNPSAPGAIVYIDTYQDPVTLKAFVLWGDIVQAFEDAIHVRYNSRVIPFLKGADFNP
jgi:translation initiation factor 2 gamma subunit (eIF-2gamma)